MPSVLPSDEEYAQLAPRPGSPVWLAFNDIRMLTTAGYATLLQVARPTVGAGVHEYSSFTKDPWGRLLRTLDYVHGTIYGGPELAGSIGRRVREMHKTIRGTRTDGQPYHAMEPDAFAWVHATLAAAIVEGRRVFAKPMTPTEKDQFWQQWIGVGRIFRAMAAASRASAPFVRGPLREFGPNYVRWRREALERGDVAAAGSPPDRRVVPA